MELIYFSGIFGVFLSLSNIKLMEFNLDKAELSKITGVAKVNSYFSRFIFL